MGTGVVRGVGSGVCDRLGKGCRRGNRWGPSGRWWWYEERT